MKVIRKRIGVPLAVLLGLALTGEVAVIGARPTVVGGGPLPVTTPVVSPRPADAPTPVPTALPGSARARRVAVTGRRLVVLVRQALRAEFPDAVWGASPAHSVRTGRDGRTTSVQVGAPLVHQGRRGELRVRVSFGPPSFDWSCRSADRRTGALCDESPAPDGTRTKVQTSVGRDGSVRHRVDVELPEHGRLRLDVHNGSGAVPPAADAPLLMEEAQAVALDVAARIGP
ncbi:hypothetical protein Q3W71_17675 [Micromonospora sp. C28SCA-DRY-2]|uniref:hypothetical protein n=1 Tax=Micromonospora sp. C28SCA-DRY-2 TaxID=3059522 RepID=UPI0026771D84|nr:hypothetical protein [Micromonospora sp. C28SCA-DRY-2]MDO3703503.1 hypothetical protein [Micromonospora sp. C28SCA-DRY-2]